MTTPPNVESQDTVLSTATSVPKLESPEFRLRTPSAMGWVGDKNTQMSSLSKPAELSDVNTSSKGVSVEKIA
jgi:hypothetical protein